MAVFALGDKVKITGKFGQDKGEAYVVKLLRTRLVLSNGERYTYDGTLVGPSGTRSLGRSITRVAQK